MTSPRFTIAAKPLANALALVSAIIHRSNTIPVLACVRLQVDGDALRLTTTDLDTFLTVNLCHDGEAVDGEALVDAKTLASLAKVIAKVKGALIRCEVDGERLQVASGRARQSLPLVTGDELPTWRDLGEAAEIWTIAAGERLDDVRSEGLQAVADAKVFAKVRAYAGADAEFAALRFDPAKDGDPARFIVNAGKVTLGTKAARPAYRYTPQRGPRFFANLDPAAYRAAEAYLRALRASHRLPAILGDEKGGSVIDEDGVAKGLTVGEGYHARSQWSEPFAWQVPEGVANDGGRCEVDGVTYRNLRDDMGPGIDPTGTLWARWEVAEIEGFRYPDGAYSVPMPRHAAEAMVAAEFVETDEGERLPLLLKETRHECHLSAEEVRALCGPVDPATFVAIPDLVIHGREIIARDGVDANGLRYVAASAPTIMDGKRRRKMTDREQLQAYCADPVGFTASLRPSWFMPADAAEPRQVDVAPALPPVAERATEPEVAPILPPEPVATPEPVAIGAADLQPAPVPAGAAANAPELGIADRLARLEALLGVAAAPVGKRTPAHAAAIRRAWRIRCEARARADLDRRALLQANGMNATLSETMLQQAERIRRLEAVASQAQARASAEYATERGELVDRLQQAIEDRRERDRAAFAAAARADRQTARADRLARRAAGQRRELGRTRAARDGLAHNLAVMASRAAADAADLERLRSASPDVVAPRPSFIMSSR